MRYESWRNDFCISLWTALRPKCFMDACPSTFHSEPRCAVMKHSTISACACTEANQAASPASFTPKVNVDSLEMEMMSLSILILPSKPELRRCSPRSQPNTLSFKIPRCFSFCFVGRDFMNVRRKVMSLPCFLDTKIR